MDVRHGLAWPASLRGPTCRQAYAGRVRGPELELQGNRGNGAKAQEWDTKYKSLLLIVKDAIKFLVTLTVTVFPVLGKVLPSPALTISVVTPMMKLDFMGCFRFTDNEATLAW